MRNLELVLVHGLSKNHVAGSVGHYSNQAIEVLTESLGSFARPQHPEKTAQEVQRLIEGILSSEEIREPRSKPQTHNAERRLGVEAVASIISLYESGSSAHAIGKQFAIGAATVMRIVRRNGTPVHDPKLSSETIQEAVQMYKSGLGLQPLANKFFVSKSTIRRALIDADVTLRPPKHY